MKNIVVLLVFNILIVIGGYAQDKKRTAAYMYNANGEYHKAKEAIDQATKHEETMYDAKTWLYASTIYYNIAYSPNTTEKQPNALTKSYKALQKAKKYDKNGQYRDEIFQYLLHLSAALNNQGSLAYQDSDYMNAIDNFKLAFHIAQEDGRFDTITAFNIGMAGILADKPDVSAEYFAKCVEVNFNNPSVYIYYHRALKQLGDKARALDIIQLGRERFPEELSLLLEETQLYLESDEKSKLQMCLIEVVEKDPKNINILFLLGKTYDDSGDVLNALKYYQKAVDLAPDFFEAYYNMGAIYVNKASEIQADANNLPLSEEEKYNELTKKATENLELAVPYLEKSLEIKPTDASTITALKESYVRLKMDDKLEKLNQQ